MDPEYVVFVMPPKGVDAEPFDIPEWECDDAMATAGRYRERGWRARIIDYGTPFAPRRARRPDGPDIRAMARACDEAVIEARVIGEDYRRFQRED